MKEALVNLHKQFPSLPQKSLMKVYKARLERMRLLMIKGILLTFIGLLKHGSDWQVNFLTLLFHICRV